MDLGLKGKVVLVTGGSQGTRRAAAARMADASERRPGSIGP
jgi:NAD(P)-dependent dehydrogenase (short-subunit alcohol dehydrogenase family)